MRRSTLHWSIPTLLTLQLGLIWIQGAQLHRQNQLLQGLREDVQELAESLDATESSDSGDLAPAVPARRVLRSPRKLAVLGAEEEQDEAIGEGQALRDSVQKQARGTEAKPSRGDQLRRTGASRQAQVVASRERWASGILSLAALALVAVLLVQRRPH